MSKLIDLRSLEAFYWVIELQSFSRAAHHLNTSQPAVSQRISALEQRMGHPLLVRPTRGCMPTDSGKSLFEYANQFLRLHARMESELVHSQNIRRTVRLGVSETIVHTWLSEFVEAAHQQFPNLTIDITVDISPRMHQSLKNMEIDLALMLGPVSDPNLEHEDLNSMPLSYIARPGLLPAGSGVTIEDIVRFPIITYPRETHPVSALEELVAKKIGKSPRIFANASLSTIVKMAKDGIGVALIPNAVVRAEIERGDLTVLDLATELRPLSFVATYPHSFNDQLYRQLSRIAQSSALRTQLDN